MGLLKVCAQSVCKICVYKVCVQSVRLSEVFHQCECTWWTIVALQALVQCTILSACIGAVVPRGAVLARGDVTLAWICIVFS